MGIAKVSPAMLEAFSKDAYVDSPVYFRGSRFVRWLNWRKLEALMSLAPDTGCSVLDLCCGNGVLLPELSQRFKKVIAVDLHTKAAKRLNYTMADAQVITGNAHHLWMLEHESVDYVIAASALEHFKSLRPVVQEIYRVLKPCGALLWLSPTENWMYRLGRKLLGYEKPKDHYYPACKIRKFLRQYFTQEVKKDFPLPFISAYEMGRFRKTK